MRTTLIALSASFLGLFAAPALAAGTLTIYTYEGFTADWGAGPAVKKAFEKECDCTLQFVSVTDGVAMLNRIRLEGKATRADIALGLDTSLVGDAKATGLFAPHKADLSGVKVPGDWKDDVFVPYDYGYFAVVYDTQKIKTPPRSMKELIEGEPRDKIVLQDPRTSTPGLGMVLWMRLLYGNQTAQAWQKLKDRVLTVTPGWSESYGLFTKGEAPMVLSYTTSPAYHMMEEHTDRYQAAPFSEGHYVQIEVAGITVKGAENPLAQEFIRFMVSPAFQDIIPTANWMLPVARMDKPLDPAFGRLVQPSKPLYFSTQEVAENRKAWVEEWLSVMSK